MLKKELRRYRRIALDLTARVTINAIDEYDARLINISPGDMAIKIDAPAIPGDAVVVAIDGLDILEGRVARTFPDGIAVSFMLSRKRRLLLTEQLMLRSNRQFSEGLGDRRNALRHNEHDKRMVCRLPDGTSLFVKIIDQSVDGIAVDAPRKPPVGTSIHVGRARGVVTRHTPRGFVVVRETEAENEDQKLRVV
ncbi:MAG: PilZ domain-containing protein [Pseudomonadota bacterium]